MKKRGIAIAEVLVAALILTIVSAGTAGIYFHQANIMAQSAHRLAALNYASSCADKLLAIETAEGLYLGQYGAYPLPLSPGLHDEATDPEFCTLPETYFKTELNGSLKYYVDKIVLTSQNSRSEGVLRIAISVEWEESFPKKQSKSETLVIIPAFYVEEKGLIFIGD